MDRSLTEPGRHVMFLAEDGARPLRLAFGIRRPDGVAYLGGMWVHPDARGRGIGRALGQSVIDWARDERFPQLDLWVTDGNAAAQALYERLGFVTTGERDRLPWNADVAVVEMRLDLERGAVSP
jgi:GNAT superfamily N-acetyltransferase